MMNQLPLFPRSEPLRIEHKPLFDEALRRSPPVASEYTFTNLYAWRNAYAFCVSRLDDFLVISSTSGPGPVFYAPAGAGDLARAMEVILNEGGGPLARVPESLAALLRDDPRYTLRHDPDNDDYVYRVDDLVKLAGRKYDGKRNLIKKFKSAYKYTYADLDHTHAQQCLSFKEQWCLLKDCDSGESLRHEKEAVREMILHCETFGLMGGALFVGGEMAALAVGEQLNPYTFVLHILKAHANMPGLYQTMLNEFLAHRGAGFTDVNMEQDLGVPGLRKSKESYYPAFMVKKYTISKTI